MGFKSSLLLLILFAVTALPAQDEQPQPTGAIYGVVIGRDGQSAPGVRLTAYPQGVVIAGMLPATKTDSAGRYRFEKLQLGRYTVFAHDEDAGYPDASATFYATDTPSREVNVTAEHPEAEFRVDLPPKAGFLQIHLTELGSGAEIRTMRVKLVWADDANRLLSSSSYSNRVLLLPPDKDVLLHVTSDGFSAWDQSIHLRSEERVTLNVHLEPLTP